MTCLFRGISVLLRSKMNMQHSNAFRLCEDHSDMQRDSCSSFISHISTYENVSSFLPKLGEISESYTVTVRLRLWYSHLFKRFRPLSREV